MRILVSDTIAVPGLDLLRKATGLQVEHRPDLSADELKACIGEYEGLIVRSRTKVTAEILANASRLRVIGRAGIGVDNIDVATATTAGVVVMNTPEGNTNTAAEHTIAMLLALARNIAPADGAMKRGEWERDRFVGVEVVGKILGSSVWAVLAPWWPRRPRAWEWSSWPTIPLCPGSAPRAWG